MKKLLLFFFILPLACLAQQIKGVVKDAESEEPVPFITISVEQSPYYVVTNEEGEFILEADEVFHKTIRINNIYFSDYEQKITTTAPFEIQLTPLAYEMEEMLIYNQPIKKVFEDIITTSEKMLQTNARMETYYKEKYYEKDHLLKDAEALVDFYVKHKTNKMDAVVKESRVEDSPYQASKSKEEQDKQILLAIAPEDMMESAMRFKILRTIIKEKKYECYITAKKSKEKELHTLYFKPVEGSTEEMLFTGKVVFDPQTQLILEFDLKFDENSKQYNSFKNFIIARAKLNDVQRLVKYNYADNMYYLTYLHADYDVSITSKLAKINTSLASFSQIYVLGIEKTITFPDKKQIFKGSQLYKAGTNYTSEFWKRADIINYSK